MKSQADEMFDVLKEKIKTYTVEINLELIKKAYELAKEAHSAQRRESGEPYILHPLQVAITLAELNLDEKAITAAILHDVVEDTSYTNEDMKNLFDEEVAQLIDGVTKLGRIYFKTKEQQKIEAYRKLIVATAKDIRVILIKLADRLHNMQTLKFTSEEKRKRISKETLELYAPLADRLGIFNIKWQLEDLCLRYLEPKIYYDLVEKVKQKRLERQIYVSEAVRLIEEELDEGEIPAKISGRAKHFYSIYRKMLRHNKDIAEIYDLYAVRILVEDIKSCYNVLGLIHSKWRPILGRFKDYIATPKNNGYRSLHTTVMVLGYPLEIQIRTYAMHQISEYGVAAHWKYKESGKSVSVNTRNDTKWLKQMARIQKEIKDPKEYLETLKLDFFNDEVFVFTPIQDLVVLTKGSCPIDFAYKVHTEVGNHCVGAKVNGQMVSLEYKLQSGDFVEIITNRSNNGPSRDWLNFVASPNTRSKIRSWFKHEDREKNILNGNSLIETELKKLGYRPNDLLKEDRLMVVCQKMGIASEEDLLASVGYGGVSVQTVIAKLLELHKKEVFEMTSSSSVMDEIKQNLARGNKATTQADQGILVENEVGFLVKLARCCTPIPGDEIFGYITQGYGISVHRADCPNALRAVKNLNRVVEVHWNTTTENSYLFDIEIVCEDKNGILTNLLAVPTAMNLRIQSVKASANKNGKTTKVFISVEVENIIQANTLMAKLRRVDNVCNVTRPMKFLNS